MMPGVMLGQQADSSFWLLHTEPKGITYIDDTTFRWEPDSVFYLNKFELRNADLVYDPFLEINLDEFLDENDIRIFTIETGSGYYELDGEYPVYRSPVTETWVYKCGTLTKLTATQTITTFYNPTK